VNLHPSVPRVAQRFFFAVAFVTLAYAGGSLAYAELYQRYQSWKFASKIDTVNLVGRAPVGAQPVDLSEGGLIGKLEIPQIGLSVMVLQGVEEDTLLLGAGHVPGTPLPGGEGNFVIAGHRDTFFRKLKDIQPGDSVQFSTLRGASEYVVESTEIVEPDETRVMESRGIRELTLISCYPFYFVGAAPHRFIVHALPARSSLP
jgi:LPXTG-site transpeptidase (sortase) family protein